MRLGGGISKRRAETQAGRRRKGGRTSHLFHAIRRHDGSLCTKRRAELKRFWWGPGLMSRQTVGGVEPSQCVQIQGRQIVWRNGALLVCAETEQADDSEAWSLTDACRPSRGGTAGRDRPPSTPCHCQATCQQGTHVSCPVSSLRASGPVPMSGGKQLRAMYSNANHAQQGFL